MAVSHSAYIRALLAFYLDTPYDKARALAQENCCVNVLEFEVLGDGARSGAAGARGGGEAYKAPGVGGVGKVAALAINDARHLELARRREEGR